MTAPNPVLSINSAAEVASEAATHGGGGWLTAAVSGMALVASAASLWESTFKQADLNVYMSENIHYTRDPYGSAGGTADHCQWWCT